MVWLLVLGFIALVYWNHHRTTFVNPSTGAVITPVLVPQGMAVDMQTGAIVPAIVPDTVTRTVRIKI